MKTGLAMCFAAVLGLAACQTPVSAPPFDRYEISAQLRAEIPDRMLAAVNALRQEAGVAPLVLDPALSAAAAGHSKDMSRQNRPWHFGSDGSSPLQRVAAAGFTGIFLGEAVSETYETELETISVWAANTDTRAVLLAPAATHLGVGFFQERSGKLWWTLVTGARS